MTTNKPKVVVYRYTASRSFGKRNRKWHYQESFPHASNREVAEIGQMEELIRLSDYHALQAECDTLVEALEAAYQYMQQREVLVDSEWGHCRDFPTLERHGDLHPCVVIVRETIATHRKGGEL